MSQQFKTIEASQTKPIDFLQTAKVRRRVLFVSGFFPPNAPMGAVRPGKLQAHWNRQNHDVRTLAIKFDVETASEQGPQAGVFYVPHHELGQSITAIKANIMRLLPLRSMQSARRMNSNGGNGAPDGPANHQSFFDVAEIYRQVLLFPDRYRSWVAPAVELGASWAPQWVPDIIYSSGPPHSSHLVAERLARRLGVPWIAELRDLWADNPYEDRHPILRPFLERLARRTLASAQACVAVTSCAQKALQQITSRPVALSYNGYDPADFSELGRTEPFDPKRLTIVHAGVIYPGRRDPGPLFEAISQLGARRAEIRCLFYHDETNSVRDLAARYGVESSVEIKDRVARAEILQIERAVDVLLECRWRDPTGDGVIPGKLFEYIGARRPILSLGSLTGEAAEIVRTNGLGLASNDPDEIKQQLLKWLDEKARTGRLSDLPSRIDDQFCRRAQFEKIDALIESQCPPARSARALNAS